MKTEKITHMQRRWGTPQNFCLTFIDEFEKQLFIKKNPVKWANKKFKNLNIYNAAFKKKKRKTPSDIIILHLCTKNLDDMIYSFWDIEYDRLKLVIMGLSLLLYPVPIKTQKIWILKKWRKLLQISSFYTHVPKTKIIWDTEVFVIMGHFFLFKPHSP